MLVERPQVLTFHGPADQHVPRPQVDFATSTLVVSYPYLGHRPYIQGVIGLNAMMACVQEFEPTALAVGSSIRQAKAFKEITTMAWAEAMASAHARSHPLRAKALARVDLESPAGDVTAMLFPIENRPVTDRLDEYEFGEYVTDISVGGDDGTSGHMDNMADVIDLICGVEECFRDIIIEEHGVKKEELIVRWGYAEDFPLFAPADVARINAVYFDAPQVLRSANGHFDIRVGRLNDRNSGPTFTMCFFVAPAGPAQKETAR